MKKALALMLAALMVLAMFAGCSQKPAEPSTPSTPSKTPAETPAETPKEEYVIHYPTHQIGANSSAPANAEMVRTFNEKYAGTYKIEVEEVPGDQNYQDKMKTLLASDALPDFVYGSGLTDLINARGLAMDLTPVLDADPEWKALFPQTVLDYNSRDGKVLALPNEGQLVGYYYNTELYAKAGIEGPAKTWDEFFEICKKLKDAGITPISMQTGDNAFVSQLWLSEMIATHSDEGRAFMTSPTKTENYEQACFIDSLKMLQRIWTEGYTTKDSIGGMYENAANNFISGNTAMIANGTWMVGSFTDPAMGGSEEFLAKVDIALYPGDVYVANPFEGFLVCAQTEEGKEAGVTMLKHWTSAETMASNLKVAGLVPSGSIEIPQEVIDSNRLLGKMLELSNAEGAQQNYSLTNRMFPGVSDTWAQQLTLFADGGTTAEDFAKVLTESAVKNKI